MRQFWVSLLLLLAMVVLLVWNAVWLEGLITPMEEDLAQGAAAAQMGDWEQVAVLTQRATARWQENQRHLRLVQIHGEIDEVSALLGELEGTLSVGEVGEYLAANRRAGEKLDSLHRTEQISLENLF